MQPQSCELALLDCEMPGMDQHLRKPRELSQLNEALNHWAAIKDEFTAKAHDAEQPAH